MTIGDSLVRLGRHRSVLAALAIGLAASSMTMWTATNAAFTAITVNPDNSWTTGTVMLTADNTATATFNDAIVLDGETDTKCVRVDYDGNVASTVKLFATPHSDNPAAIINDAITGGFIGDRINLTVEQGFDSNGGASALNCSDFTADDVPGNTDRVFDGTLTAFATHEDLTTWADGVSAVTAWTPSGVNDYKVFKFTWDASAIDDVANDDEQGKRFACSFTWKSQQN